MLFSALLLAALLAPPQSHGGHSGHSGHSSQGPSPSRSRQEESAPKVKATNTVCPVMGRAVKPGRDREVVIRGNYYLVCCDGCGPEMSEHYDKYLDKDGKPLNTPKKDDAKPESTSPEEHQH